MRTISNNKRSAYAMDALKRKCGLNNIGAMNSYGRMLKSVQNYSSSYDEIGPSFNPLWSMKNFSRNSEVLSRATNCDFSADFSGTGPGMTDNNGIAASDILDITITASVNSFLEFLAIDKACDKPNTILSASRLVRVIEDKDGNEIEAPVVDPFKPMTPGLDLSVTGAQQKVTSTAAEVLALGIKPVCRKRTVGTYKVGSKTILIEDLKGDGTLSISCGDASLTGIFKMDYVNGKILYFEADGVTPATMPAGIEFKVYPDTTSEKDGIHTQVWREVKKKFEVNCEPVRVKLEQSIEKLDYDKKLFNIPRGAVAVNLATDGFIYSLNGSSVSTSVMAAFESHHAENSTDDMDYRKNCIFYDISGYELSSFAPTKDNIVNDFMLALESDITLNSDKVYTYILVGNLGARVLQNVKDRFVSVPVKTVDERSQDALIGYYNQIPVLRHQIITGLDNNLNKATSADNPTVIPADETIDGIERNLKGSAHFFVGYRSPSGTAAPVIYAEYLPIISTRASLNYYNPTQFSQVLFNYSKFEKLITNYTRIGLLKVNK